MEVALEVAILLGIALPFARLLVCRPFLRRLGGAPEMAIVAFGALAAYVLAIALIAFVAPVVLRPLVVIAVALAAFAWWRSRPRFGQGNGLPPGTLRVAPLGRGSTSTILLATQRGSALFSRQRR